MAQELTPEGYESLSTYELLYYLASTRRFRGFAYLGEPDAGGPYLTKEGIKRVLATREHVPNKAERRQARQLKAKLNKGQGKQHNR